MIWLPWRAFGRFRTEGIQQLGVLRRRAHSVLGVEMLLQTESRLLPLSKDPGLFQPALHALLRREGRQVRVLSTWQSARIVYHVHEECPCSWSRKSNTAPSARRLFGRWTPVHVYIRTRKYCGSSPSEDRWSELKVLHSFSVCARRLLALAKLQLTTGRPCMTLQGFHLLHTTNRLR